MEWSYHSLIEDKCQYPSKRQGTKLKKNLLLWNYCANLNQTLLKWSLGGPLSKLCPSGRTQFWKGTTEGSFQQSLVEIGTVVSEERIFFLFHPPFFLICIIGQNRQKFKVHKKSGGPLSKLCPSAPSCIQDGHHY
jgi:hypothetical protein